jgi:hypothetical protein
MQMQVAISRGRVWQLIVASVLACVCLVSGFFVVSPGTFSLTFSETDDAQYRNIYAVEQDESGQSYHWTSAGAQFIVPRTSWFPLAIVGVTLLDSARPLTVQLDSLAIEVNETRRVFILVSLPQNSAYVDINAPILQSTTDPRSLGVRISNVLIYRVGNGVPAPIWFAVLCVLVILLTTSMRVSGVTTWHLWSVVLVVPLLMLWAVTHDASMATGWVWNWVLTWWLLVVASVVMRYFIPDIPIGVRVLFLIWMLVRLIGVTYPGFEGHDYLIHLKRLLAMQETQQWTALDYPYEFNRRPALIVPLFYALSAVFEPLLGISLAMHTIAVCVETATALVVWVLTQRLAVPMRVRVIAIMLLLAMPLSSAVLWWSFFPQILAHFCLFGMMMSVVRRDMRGAWWSGVWCAAIAWSHIGEILIAVVWYICVRIYEPDRGTRDWWMRWVPIMLIPLSALVVYIPYIQLLMAQSALGVPSLRTPPLLPRLSQIKEAFAVGFAPIPWWLFPIIWGVAWRRVPLLARPWLIAATVWIFVELVSGYQVRYIYFTVPLLVLGISYILVPHTRRGWAGRMFVMTIVLFVTWVSFAHWHDVTLLWYRMRVDGLTH